MILHMQKACVQSIRRSTRTILSPLFTSRFNHAAATTGTPTTPPTPEHREPPRQTHFGFRTIAEEDKEYLVRSIFSSVASKYDLMNDAMSMGVHRLWKDEFVSLLKPGSKGHIKCLDVAGGTGDIALRILDYAREKYADRETTVDIADINPEMLKEGYTRFKKTMYHNSMAALNFPVYPALVFVPSPTGVLHRSKRAGHVTHTVKHVRSVHHRVWYPELHVHTCSTEGGPPRPQTRGHIRMPRVQQDDEPRTKFVRNLLSPDRLRQTSSPDLQFV